MRTNDTKELVIKIEAYGVKGMNSKPWRRVFANVEKMLAWAEANDAEVCGTREIDSTEAA